MKMIKATPKSKPPLDLRRLVTVILAIELAMAVLAMAVVATVSQGMPRMAVGTGLATAGLILVSGIASILFIRARVLTPLSLLADRTGVDGREVSDLLALRSFASPELHTITRAFQGLQKCALETRRLREEQEELRFEQMVQKEEQEAEFKRTSEIQQSIVEQLGQQLQRLAAGNLNTTISDFFPPEYKRLRMDFNQAVNELSRALAEVRRRSDAVAVEAQNISANTDALALRGQHQAGTLEETAAAHHEITAAVAKTLGFAREASSKVGDTQKQAEQSRKLVSEAIDAIHSIEAFSRQITQIIGVIDEISFQTNLLALNAGVEAARAGDAGRGFAVVAQEVRALAQRSAAAAKEIKTLISDSANAVSHGVQLVSGTGTALNGIVDQIATVATHIHHIASSAEEQAGGLMEVNRAIDHLDKSTQQNAADSQQSTESCARLCVEANELADLVKKFKLVDGDPSTAAQAA